MLNLNLRRRHRLWRRLQQPSTSTSSPARPPLTLLGDGFVHLRGPAENRGVLYMWIVPANEQCSGAEKCSLPRCKQG